MKTLLRIDTSMRRDGSQSRMLADHYEALWKKAHPNGRVVTRDLAREPVPHLTDEAFAAFREPAGGAGGASLSDVLIQELMDADHLLIGAPMYNFAMPSPLAGSISVFISMRIIVLSICKVYILYTISGALFVALCVELAELFGLLMGRQRINDLVQIAV